MGQTLNGCMILLLYRDHFLVFVILMSLIFFFPFTLAKTPQDTELTKERASTVCSMADQCRGFSVGFLKSLITGSWKTDIFRGAASVKSTACAGLTYGHACKHSSMDGGGAQGTPALPEEPLVAAGF